MPDLIVAEIIVSRAAGGYAAALRVLTRHPRLDDVDVAHALARTRGKGEVSPVERVITQAVQVATNPLLPRGFDSFVWRTLSAEERFYLKALELQSHGEARTGAGFPTLSEGGGRDKERDPDPDAHGSPFRLRHHSTTRTGRPVWTIGPTPATA